MNLFFTMNPTTLIGIIEGAKKSILILTPGLNENVADCLCRASKLGIIVTIITKMEEDAFRQGYGDFSAIQKIREFEISILEDATIDIGLIIIDATTAYVFSPLPQVIADIPADQSSQNAMMLQDDWIIEYYNSVLAKVKAIEAGDEPKDETNDVTIIGQKVSTERQPDFLETVEQHNIPFIPKPATPKTQRIDEQKAMAMGKSIKDNPPVSFDLSKLLNVYKNNFMYIEMEFPNSRIEQKTINIAKELALKDFPDEVTERFNTSFKIFTKEDIDKIGTYKNINERYEQIKSKYVKTIGSKRVVILVKDKGDITKVLNELKDDISKDNLDLVKELSKKIKSQAEIITRDLSDESVIKYKSKQGIPEFYPLKDIRLRLLLNLEDALYRVIGKIETKREIKFFFKDITLEDIKDKEFTEKLKHEFFELDWSKFNAVDEKSAIQKRETAL